MTGHLQGVIEGLGRLIQVCSYSWKEWCFYPLNTLYSWKEWCFYQLNTYLYSWKEWCFYPLNTLFSWKKWPFYPLNTLCSWKEWFFLLLSWLAGCEIICGAPRPSQFRDRWDDERGWLGTKNDKSKMSLCHQTDKFPSSAYIVSCDAWECFIHQGYDDFQTNRLSQLQLTIRYEMNGTFSKYNYP